MKFTDLVFSGLIAAVVAFASGCSKPAGDKIEIQRLDLAIEESDTMGASRLEALNKQLAPGIAAYREINALSSYLPEGEGLKSVRYPGALAFTPDVRARLGGLDSVEMALYAVSQSIPEELTAIQFPSQFYGVEWPYNQSMAIVSDTVALIALNHYLGADYEGYQSFDVYRRRNKHPRRIPYDVAEALVRSAYPLTDSVTTVVGRMVYEGAVLEAVEKMVHGATEANLLGYDNDELNWAMDNEGEVWDAMIGRELLFSTSDFDKVRLFDPAPSSTIINSAAPGRIGRYIGLQLVRSLRRHHRELGLDEILTPGFYTSDDLLQRVGYTPQKRR